MIDTCYYVTSARQIYILLCYFCRHRVKLLIGRILVVPLHYYINIEAMNNIISTTEIVIQALKILRIILRIIWNFGIAVHLQPNSASWNGRKRIYRTIPALRTTA